MANPVDLVFGTSTDTKPRKQTVDPNAFKGPKEGAFKGPDSSLFKGPAQKTEEIAASIARAQGRTAPTREASSMQAAQIAQGPQEQVRGQQQQLIQALQARAAGEAPSAGQLALKRQTDEGMKRLLAAAASQRGGSAAAAQRALVGGTATLGQQAAGRAGEIAAAEQAAAEQTLGQQLSGTRGQDIGLATSQAQLGQQASVQNLQAQEAAAAQNIQAQLATQSQIDAQTQFYESQGLTREMAKAKAQQDLATQRSQAAMQHALAQSQSQQALAGLQTQTGTTFEAQRLAAEQAKQQQQLQTLGTLGQLGLGVATVASDKTVKTKVKDGKKAGRKFLEALGSHKYEYKDQKKHGKGSFLSPMAQEIEKAGPVGKSMVVTDAEGVKRVDYGRGLGTMLANQSDQHERLKRLETILKARKGK